MATRARLPVRPIMTLAWCLAMLPVHSAAQQAAGAPGTVRDPATTAQPLPAPATRDNRLPEGLLRELLRAIPRRRAPLPEPAPAPSPAPTATASAVPAAPAKPVEHATGPIPSHAVPPRPVAIPLPPRPAASPRARPPLASRPPAAHSSPAVRDASEPSGVTQRERLPEPPAASPAPQPAAPIPAPPPPAARATFGLSAWTGSLAIIALLAAIAAAAAGRQWRKRQILAHTRAALALSPSLDHSRGHSSIGQFTLAAPPVTIRARLDMEPAGDG